MINRVILTGRLTTDIELRRTNDGNSFAYFVVAVNRRTQDQTDFISCVAWRQTAEIMNQYLKKGSLVGLEGRLEVFSQQKDGNYETRTTVNVSNITFLESKNQSNNKSPEQSFESDLNQEMNSSEQTMNFSSEESFNSNEKTFGKVEEINAKDINLEEIKF